MQITLPTPSGFRLSFTLFNGVFKGFMTADVKMTTDMVDRTESEEDLECIALRAKSKKRAFSNPKRPG